jgi:hypothetical protein
VSISTPSPFNPKPEISWKKFGSKGSNRAGHLDDGLNYLREEIAKKE